MTTTAVRSLIVRDLGTMIDELNAYPNEADLWKEVPGIGNPTGTLALHLAGNLRHFIGALLGDSGYVRDRPAEFARRDVSRNDLVAELEDARAAVEQTFAQLSDEDLARPFPVPPAGVPLTAGAFLMHLVTHTAYHLGQADYHRRAVTGEAGEVRALSIVAPG